MQQIWYRQCTFGKTLSEGRSTQTAWIPEKFAKLGDVLKFKNDDGTWDDGWVVELVGSRKTAKEVELDGSIWKKTRKHSDVPGGTFKKD